MNFLKFSFSIAIVMVFCKSPCQLNGQTTVETSTTIKKQTYLKGLEDAYSCAHECCLDTIQLTFQRGNVTIDIPGKEVLPHEVVDEPIVSYNWWKFVENQLFTFLMTEADAPSFENRTNRDWRHWLIVNVPKSDIKFGDAITVYKGAGPPKDSGLHRYVFFVYVQNHPINATAVRLELRDERAKFNVSKFAFDYQLGDPYFCNYHTSRYLD